METEAPDWVTNFKESPFKINNNQRYFKKYSLIFIPLNKRLSHSFVILLLVILVTFIIFSFLFLMLHSVICDLSF